MTTQTEHHTLFADARDLSAISGESIDLVVTSPPYPMIEMWDPVFAHLDPGADPAVSGAAAYEHMHLVLDAVWQECYRVLKPGSFACINVGDATRSIGENFRLYTNHVRVTEACEGLGFQSLPPILWRKQTNAPTKFMGSGTLPAGAYVTLEHEYVLVFRKGERRSWSKTDGARRRQSAFFWEERNSWFSDLWDFRGIPQALNTTQTRARSGAFPFELAFRLICMFSLYEDRVLDPFLGTGTTVAAAISAGRNSIGAEIDDSFGTVIDETVVRAAASVNRRQQERLAAHEEFRLQRERDGKSLYYRNAPHDTPVMTRQERELEIRITEEIWRQSHDRLIARHTLCSANSPAEPHVEIEPRATSSSKK